MAATDNTLLQRLGFNDPDKKEPLHDVACRYLIQPKVAGRLIDTFYSKPRTGRVAAVCSLDRDSWDHKTELTTQLWRVASEGSLRMNFALSPGRLEAAISKGEGPYRTTVGFLDGHVPFRVDVTSDAVHQTVTKIGNKTYDGFKVRRTTEEPGKPLVETTGADLFLEAKICPVSVGQILRQMNLYREYRMFLCHGTHPQGLREVCAGFAMYSRRPTGAYAEDIWVVATAFDLSVEEVGVLNGAGLHHVRLGPAFDAYAALPAVTANSMVL